MSGDGDLWRERELIEWIATEVKGSRTPEPPIGVGDDAAVLKTDVRTVWCADMLVEGTHFLWAEATPEQVGHKALAVNLSDLAAMGAWPTAAIATLAIPTKPGQGDRVKGIIRGLIALGEKYDCPLVGGDLCKTEGPMVISVSVSGVPLAHPIQRAGAQVGDVIYVTGELGGSRRGKHLCFEPRLREVRELLGQVPIHAMIDISDGLALDLARLLTASRVGATLQRDRIPISPGCTLDQALYDGEDFELCLTVPSCFAARIESCPYLRRVGIVSEPPHLRWEDGEPISVKGYEHRG